MSGGERREKGGEKGEGEEEREEKNEKRRISMRVRIRIIRNTQQTRARAFSGVRIGGRR